MAPDSPSEPSLERRATRVMVTAVRGGEVRERDDRLAGEEPMAIRVAGPGQAPIDVAIAMRTPGHEAELAVGFLYAEGLIAGVDQVAGVELGHPGVIAQPDDEVLVRLREPFDAASLAQRHFAISSACGICGKAALDDIHVRAKPIPDGPLVTPELLWSLPARLREAQAVFEATGGLHAAGLFAPDGTLIAVREDIGRHNALDKLIGGEVLAGRAPLHDRIILVSGRAGFELVQKAAIAGAPILAAVSAPSDLAVDAARRLGITLIGFLRGDGFNVYTRPERVATGRV
ncbi:MAG: formate dehydrogenase accessory sulfurtransferase FdhD [Chloroflexota bacterium]